jgi:hexosaminidase
MHKLNIENTHELQSYFIRKIDSFVHSHNRNIIGWDEILEGGLAENAWVMSWRGVSGGVAAAKQKHQVVMTPGTHCYFDHYQDTSKDEPLAIGGYTPLEKVYNYKIIPEELNSTEKQFIQGAQGNVWTEYMPHFSHVQYMTLPRMLALSEVLWGTNTDFIDFDIRMHEHKKYFKEVGWNYKK